MEADYTPEQIAEMRKRWDIPEGFVPVATVAGVVTAWGTKALVAKANETKATA